MSKPDDKLEKELMSQKFKNGLFIINDDLKNGIISDNTQGAIQATKYEEIKEYLILASKAFLKDETIKDKMITLEDGTSYPLVGYKLDGQTNKYVPTNLEVNRICQNLRFAFTEVFKEIKVKPENYEEYKKDFKKAFHKESVLQKPTSTVKPYDEDFNKNAYNMFYTNFYNIEIVFAFMEKYIPDPKKTFDKEVKEVFEKQAENENKSISTNKSVNERVGREKEREKRRASKTEEQKKQDIIKAGTSSRKYIKTLETVENVNDVFIEYEKRAREELNLQDGSLNEEDQKKLDTLIAKYTVEAREEKRNKIKENEQKELDELLEIGEIDRDENDVAQKEDKVANKIFNSIMDANHIDNVRVFNYIGALTTAKYYPGTTEEYIQDNIDNATEKYESELYDLARIRLINELHESNPDLIPMYRNRNQLKEDFKQFDKANEVYVQAKIDEFNRTKKILKDNPKPEKPNESSITNYDNKPANSLFINGAVKNEKSYTEILTHAKSKFFSNFQHHRDRTSTEEALNMMDGYQYLLEKHNSRSIFSIIFNPRKYSRESKELKTMREGLNGNATIKKLLGKNKLDDRGINEAILGKLTVRKTYEDAMETYAKEKEFNEAENARIRKEERQYTNYFSRESAFLRMYDNSLQKGLDKRYTKEEQEEIIKDYIEEMRAEHKEIIDQVNLQVDKAVKDLNKTLFEDEVENKKSKTTAFEEKKKLYSGKMKTIEEVDEPEIEKEVIKEEVAKEEVANEDTVEEVVESEREQIEVEIDLDSNNLEGVSDELDAFNEKMEKFLDEMDKTAEDFEQENIVAFYKNVENGTLEGFTIAKPELKQQEIKRPNFQNDTISLMGYSVNKELIEVDDSTTVYSNAIINYDELDDIDKKIEEAQKKGERIDVDLCENEEEQELNILK